MCVCVCESIHVRIFNTAFMCVGEEGVCVCEDVNVCMCGVGGNVKVCMYDYY